MSEAPATTPAILGYEWDRGNCYAVVFGGKHTRGYINQEAARRAAERGALFTPDEYTRLFKRRPAWYDGIDT